MKKIKNISEALNQFEESAVKHAEATEQGDYKIANKSYDVIIKVANFLRNEGKLNLLMEFLTHSSDGVKVWAAAYLLSINAEMAVSILEQIAKGNGIQALNAETTLSEWRRKGNLKL